MDYSLPGSSVHAIVQMRILKQVAISSPRESSQPSDSTQVPCIAGRFFTSEPLKMESSQANNHSTPAKHHREKQKGNPNPHPHQQSPSELEFYFHWAIIRCLSLPTLKGWCQRSQIGRLNVHPHQIWCQRGPSRWSGFSPAPNNHELPFSM